jgi:hypothetical protein
MGHRLLLRTACLLALGLAAVQAQFIPRFAVRPAPQGQQQTPRGWSPSPGGLAAQAAGVPTVPISPSVFTFSLGDVVNSSVCKDQVTRAAKFATRSLQLVVTNYYWDHSNRASIDSFCIAEYTSSERLVNKTVVRKAIAASCRAYSANYTTAAGRTTVSKAFYAGLKECVQHAVALGFTEIILNPRLDQWIGMEGKVSPIWRAWVPFDPLGQASGLSYYDAMLAPLAAIAASVGGQVRQWRLALGGEHQWSFTLQGASYLQVLSLLRKAAPGG